MPDPEFVNPERYVAALSVFEGRDVSLSEEDVRFLAGESLGNELDDLVSYGILNANKRAGETVYRPVDEYSQSLSEECENKVSLVYGTASDMLNSEGSDKIIDALDPVY